MFTQGIGSQYFEIRNIDRQQAVPEGQGLQAAFMELKNQVTGHWRTLEQQTHDTIQQNDGMEANPWINRTMWWQYLEGYSREELLKLVEEPEQVDTANVRHNRKEMMAWLIWEAVGELGSYCQTTVAKDVGSFVLFEAIRTEKHQTRYSPLTSYSQHDSIYRHVHPWQQIVLYFLQNGDQNDPRCPKYQLNEPQQEARMEIVREARKKMMEMARERESSSESSGR